MYMTMNFDQLSDAIMLPILEKMAPPEREKLLILLRQLAHPRAYPWIDAQLALLSKAKNA